MKYIKKFEKELYKFGYVVCNLGEDRTNNIELKNFISTHIGKIKDYYTHGNYKYLIEYEYDKIPKDLHEFFGKSGDIYMRPKNIVEYSRNRRDEKLKETIKNAEIIIKAEKYNL